MKIGRQVFPQPIDGAAIEEIGVVLDLRIERLSGWSQFDRQVDL